MKLSSNFKTQTEYQKSNLGVLNILRKLLNLGEHNRINKKLYETKYVDDYKRNY